MAWSWTADISIANFFATRHGQKGSRIITGIVPKNRIIEYIGGEEQEFLVSPKDITLTDRLELYGIEFAEDKFEPIITAFHKYKEYIDGNMRYSAKMHGAAHAKRVLFLTQLLASLYGLNDKDKRLLAISSAYHDIGRLNDDEDESHGEAGVAYYVNRVGSNISGAYGISPVVKLLIKYHSLPDEKGYAHIEANSSIKDKANAVLLFKIFKDADALDRVRMGIKELDYSQLRLDESKKMTLIANMLLSAIKT
jgi:HD superfamily phosphodiesterase